MTNLLLLGLFLVVLFVFIRWRYPRPEFMPLQTNPNDPLLVAAMQTAQDKKPIFRTLLAKPYQEALVKIRFVSNTDEVEHLWAEVLEQLTSEELGVRLVTPPVTHNGALDRLYRCSLDDVEDWQVCDEAGKIHGGYTQKAMFAIARRDGVKLPKKLLEQERCYSDY